MGTVSRCALCGRRRERRLVRDCGTYGVRDADVEPFFNKRIRRHRSFKLVKVAGPGCCRTHGLKPEIPPLRPHQGTKTRKLCPLIVSFDRVSIFVDTRRFFVIPGEGKREKRARETGSLNDEIPRFERANLHRNGDQSTCLAAYTLQMLSCMSVSVARQIDRVSGPSREPRR